MNELALKQPRRVLPRWRLFTTTARHGELNFKKQKLITPADFDDGSALIKRWKVEKIPGVACEILNLAMLKKDTALATEAAAFLERHRTSRTVRSPMENIALATLRTDGAPMDDNWMQGIYRPSDRDIPSLRKSLRLYPHNAIAWAELALLHAWNGNKEHARRCMLVAVGLAPNDRFVIRSAVRCFAHLKDHETGLRIVNRSARTKLDPWLLSAQVAMTQALKKPQRLLKNAKAMIESKNISPWDLSELNAAIGSVLHHSGAEKNANKHFRASLLQPTENALCQIIFDRQNPEWHKITQNIHPSMNFESEARNHFLAVELDQACESAHGWLRDEPFSARPALFGSFVAGVAIENYKDAIGFLDQGLKPNPNDPTLLNNRALFLARTGQTAEADENLRRARQYCDGGSEMDVTLTATVGLLHFRKGETNQGRLKYIEAISKAKRAGRQGQEAMGLVFLAREELDAGTDLAGEAIKRAEQAVKRLPKSHNDTFLAMARLKTEADKKNIESHNNDSLEPQ
jgi:tetratricopeptide (TPR) repeat protein